MVAYLQRSSKVVTRFLSGLHFSAILLVLFHNDYRKSFYNFQQSRENAAVRILVIIFGLLLVYLSYMYYLWT